MQFQLLDSGWDNLLNRAVAQGCSELRVVCPFIKESVAKKLLAGRNADLIQVITRFKLGDFCGCVSDTSALRLLLQHGAKIRGVQRLHAKVYLFGSIQSIVTSANLTEAGLSRNHEFGFNTNDPSIIQTCRKYFDELWRRVGPDLTVKMIDDWDRRLGKVRTGGARPKATSGLPDFGVKLAPSSSPFVTEPPSRSGAPQSFVKFFGKGTDRRTRDELVFTWVKDSGANWKCAYPLRPHQPNDGDVMFLGWLVKKPNDIIVFGRALAMHHQAGRDDATPEDIRRKSWKAHWRYYIRVHNAEFVSGSFANGIPLSTLMNQLGSNSFVVTQQNAAAGTGNTNPRRAFRQQPSVRLSKEGQRWLGIKLDQAFEAHGKMTRAELEQLDWPVVPVSAA
jgi:PLD-like domain